MKRPRVMRAPPPPEPKAKRETNLNATARGRGEVPAALFSQLLQEVHPQPGGDHLLVLAAPSDRQVPHCQPQGVCPPQKSPAAEGQAGTDRGKIRLSRRNRVGRSRPMVRAIHSHPCNRVLAGWEQAGESQLEIG